MLASQTTGERAQPVAHGLMRDWIGLFLCRVSPWTVRTFSAEAGTTTTSLRYVRTVLCSGPLVSAFFPSNG